MIVPLGPGCEVEVHERYVHEPFSVFVSVAEDGTPILSIWAGDGDMRVLQDGVNLLGDG